MTNLDRDLEILEEISSYRGRTGLLKLKEQGGDIRVRVRVKEGRHVFGRWVDLMVEPVYGIGQAWVRYRSTTQEPFTSRLMLEES